MRSRNPMTEGSNPMHIEFDMTYQIQARPLSFDPIGLSLYSQDSEDDPDQAEIYEVSVRGSCSGEWRPGPEHNKHELLAPGPKVHIPARNKEEACNKVAKWLQGKSRLYADLRQILDKLETEEEDYSREHGKPRPLAEV